MINKLLIIFIIILNNFFLNYAYSDDQINFDVSQIEVLEGGNKIIGKKRGTITTNDGVIINADEFEYDKIKNVLKAKGNITVNDEANNYIINSENILYLKDQEKIQIKGKSSSLIFSNYNFKSEDIIILRNKLILEASKPTVIIDKKNQTLYEIDKLSYSIKDEVLKGEKIFINTKFNQPFSDKYFFKNAIFNLQDQSYIAKDIDINLKKDIFGNKNNDPRFKGISSSSKNGVTTIDKGIFTSCKKSDKCPPWSVQAKKITYDKNKKKVLYDSALIKVYDVPVMYFPKFFHPGPTVKRQSGLLVPHINNSNILGSSLQLPYFHVLSDNKDLTFKPTFFDKDSASFLLSLLENISSSLDISYQKVNNDTYLKIFDTNIVDTELKPESFDTLTSDIELNLEHEKFNFTSGFTAYEDLSKPNSDRYQYILPYYNFSKNFFDNSNFGSFDFVSQGDNILKDTNSLRSRMINNLNIQSFNFISDLGFKSNLKYYLKNTIATGKNNVEYDASPEVKFSNIIEMQSSFPLVKIDENYSNFISPKLSLRINPSSM